MGHVRGNEKDGGGYSCRITMIYHGEEAEEIHRQGVGNTIIRGGDKGSWFSNKRHIHQPQLGDGGSVGVSVYDIIIMCKWAGFRGRAAEEETVVAS